MPTPADRARTGHTAVIALGATVVLWAVTYVIMMPPLGAGPWAPVAAAALCLTGAGFLAGRLAGASWLGGARVGAAVALVNLLILGSLLGGDRPGEVVTEALGWIGGFFAAAIALGAAGAAWGRAGRTADVHVNWPGWLAVVTAAATVMLLIAGGIVTGLEAGLAVRGWLTAEDYPLILFPLRLMQSAGGVYAEHAHRLWGLLVGLCAIVLVAVTCAAGARRHVRVLAVIVLGAVIVQGVLGGTRVTEQSLVLAVLHGIFAQLVFATIVAVVVLTSRSYMSAPGAAALGSRPARTAASWLLALLLTQLVLGALYRHLHAGADVPAGLVHGVLGLHVLGAMAVLPLAVLAGVRARGSGPVARRWGIAIHGLVTVQIGLGIAALVTILLRGDEAAIPVSEVIVTTAHQVNGALLLASATAVVVWERKRRSD